MPSRMSAVLIPPAFVVIWATGFIMARLVAPHADPLFFLVVRFALAGLILAGAAILARAPWPATGRAWVDTMVAGALLHGIYLGGVFWAVAQGLPAGISALIVGAQPLLVALLAEPLLKERVPPRRWLGVATGFAGIVLVLGPKMGGGTDPYPPVALIVCAVSLLGITTGTIWQKRTGASTDLRSGTAIQFAGATLVVLPGSLLLEPMRFDPAPELWFALIWSIFATSIGAIALLLIMIRRGALVAVSSLLFLVPPVSALMGYALFGDTLTLTQVAGMAVAAVGTALAARS